MSKRCLVLCVMTVLLAGCFSSTIKQTVARDKLIMNDQGVTVRYQTYYEHLPGNDWAPYQYRHVAENRSSVAVCVHLQLSREDAGTPFFTTHVVLQPGQKRTLRNYQWWDLLPAGATFYHASKLEGVGCTEGQGWW